MSIPTAEEILNKHLVPANAMIEFAKLHVEAALYIASERADLTDNSSFPYVDKESILKSYPLDKIK
jgi:hypothetical protein